MKTKLYPENPLWTHFKNISWSFLGVALLLSLFGIAMQYSAGGGSWTPWAQIQAYRLCIALVAFSVVYFVPLRIWYKSAYLFYGLALFLLILVELRGYIGMGAQRWFKLGPINIQPSELMKVALILALARYYHGLTIFQARSFYALIIPFLLLIIPALLILRQPDLGTTLILVFVTGCMIFLSGLDKRIFWGIIVLGLVMVPLGWTALKPYQKERVLTFLDPERDPRGAGYHIIQSKIALGSGGFTGKGYMQGTQSHLNFLPEKQTDFIFTMIAEEFGFLGGVTIILLYLFLMMVGIKMALSSSTHFSRFVGYGVTASLFAYVFVNMAMVMGLLPVVGEPLPLLSYGGGSLVTTFISFGLLMAAHVHEADDLR